MEVHVRLVRSAPSVGKDVIEMVVYFGCCVDDNGTGVCVGMRVLFGGEVCVGVNLPAIVRIGGRRPRSEIVAIPFGGSLGRW